jgi:hypothetical protein
MNPEGRKNPRPHRVGWWTRGCLKTQKVELFESECSKLMLENLLSKKNNLSVHPTNKIELLKPVCRNPPGKILENLFPFFS